MPFYNIENVTERKGQGANVNHVVIGELMKAGWVVSQKKIHLPTSILMKNNTC
ncbi:MAG: hypothetical protein VX794_06505 [Nitrospinota bacterium]|nr:hypothetical protein [Nitrospinota bacterium]